MGVSTQKALSIVKSLIEDGVLVQTIKGGVPMFHLFKQGKTNPMKIKFYSPQVEYCIVFKDWAIPEIKRIKGWKTDTDMANALGITKQYICNLKKGRTPATHTVITRIASHTGNVEENWHVFFELRPIGFVGANEQQYNHAKYLGQMPYEKYSHAAELRRMDNPVEQKV